MSDNFHDSERDTSGIPQRDSEEYREMFEKWLLAQKEQEAQEAGINEEQKVGINDEQQPKEIEQEPDISFEEIPPQNEQQTQPPVTEQPVYDEKNDGAYPYGYYAQQSYAQPAQPVKKPRKGLRILALVSIIVGSILVGALLFGFVILPMVQGVTSAVQQPPTQQEEPSAQPQASNEPAELPDFGSSAPQIQNGANPVPEIAAESADSVVGVRTQETAYISGEEPQVTSISRGTGFVVSDEGYIVTNYHVVSSGTQIVVTLQDGTEHSAEYIGGDEQLDVAVLKVTDVQLKSLPIGNSDETQVGELVVAIGDPAGAGENLTGTVTVGYVSAVNRELLFNGQRQKFFQTDAAVNPGNSGGPLVNSKGEVIGIITLKSLISTFDSAGNAVTTEGIGFAIPINTAMETVQKIISTGGNVERPGIGVYYSEVTEEDAENWGVPQGAMVRSFMENSPAEAAGLQVYDVVTACDGKEITQLDDLSNIISEKKIGDVITLTVWRNGATKDIEVTIGNISQMR